MTSYLVPLGEGRSELTEKRSRFIGCVRPVSTEEEARAMIAEKRAEYHDARHNCWCYLLREGGVERYSDDGEPQGTAGQPMLDVFRRGGIQNVCCVVTRYFGGVLLGPGGLVRAYTAAAKDALAAAELGKACLWTTLSVPCSYALFERVRLELAAFGGVAEKTDYGADVTILAALPQEQAEAFCARLTELSGGGIAPARLEDAFRVLPRS